MSVLAWSLTPTRFRINLNRSEHSKLEEFPCYACLLFFCRRHCPFYMFVFQIVIGCERYESCHISCSTTCDLQPSTTMWSTIISPGISSLLPSVSRNVLRLYFPCLLNTDLDSVISNETLWRPRTCTLAHHLSLGSSMVRASYRSSEGCGFDPRLGLRNNFSEYRTWWSFIYLKIYPRSHVSKT